MSSSVHANYKTKSILILGERCARGLEDTTFYVEKMYSINFTATRKNNCLSLHYNRDNSYLLLTEIIQFKAKDSEIVANPLCLVNISEDFSSANMTKNWIIWICF